ncbi:hypothetical protein F5884DRAFT_891236 [Xylogone sp. PMI_703]|nr:hypothetical protein F5884DRAFT_891236 [Xylogone sp. PMI_703]
MAPSKLSRFRFLNRHHSSADDKKTNEERGQGRANVIVGNSTKQQVPLSKLPVTVALGLPASVDSGTVSEAPQIAALSTSQRLWNDAFNSLKYATDTAGLVKAYMKTLTAVLRPENSNATNAPGTCDALTELNDPTKRQEDMKTLVNAGLAKISVVSKITNGFGDVAQFILSAKGMIDVAIQNVPQAALPWAGVCIGLQILLNPTKAAKSNLAGITHVVSRMDWYCELTDHLLTEDCIIIGNESFESIIVQLEKGIVALYKALLLYQMKSICSYYRNQGLVFLRGLVNMDDWDSDLKSVTDAETAVQKDSDQYNTLQAKSLLGKLVKDGEERQSLLGDVRQALWDYIALQKDMHIADRDAECLQDLRVIDPQDDMLKIENNKDELLDQAYQWITHTKEYSEFTTWNGVENNLSSRRLLWIKGPAGTGKTMLLIGLIRELSDRPLKFAPNVSYFFCQGTDTALNNATSTLRSLIWLLLIQQPRLISHLREKYKNSGGALFKDRNAFYALSTAFQSMLKDPQLSPVYFVVDALDECNKEKPGVADLIKLISTSLTLTDRVKWMISSRPEVDLHSKLKDLEPSVSLLELDAQSLEGPVNAYIDHKLSTLEDRDGYDKDCLSQISIEIRHRALNTFLWVALVFRELDTVDGWYALEVIQNIPPGLLELYDHMITKIENGKMNDPQYCKNILGVATLVYRPLSLSELAVLAGLPPKVNPQTIVDKCGSFLTIKEQTVFLIHQSAKDYLEANYASRLQPTGAIQGHINISKRSIDAMSKLRVNMYDIPYSGCPSGDIKPPNPDPLVAIRYSCIFWIDHLCEFDNQSSNRGEELPEYEAAFTFFKEHLLHWLESLSLIRTLSAGVVSIKKLLHRARSMANSDVQFTAFLADTEKFILNYWPIIDKAPLQTYGAALVFCPVKSIVRNHFWGQRLPFINSVSGIQERWNPCLQILEGHNDSVEAVTFSPDGKVIASSSRDNIIRIWETTTGALKQTLECRSNWVYALDFSPDGKTLSSTSSDKTIQLWDTMTWTWKQTLEGHTEIINSVSFSPDGKTLASASDDSNIRLWDIATGISMQTLTGHEGWVHGVAYSPNGNILASASVDSTVRLWDAKTGACKQTLEGHTASVRAVAFSPDGKALASVSLDRSLRLWDATTGVLKQTLKDNRGWLLSVVFSPTGSIIATGSDDCTVRLQDATTGNVMQNFRGHSGSVRGLAFAPDSNILVSCSNDNTIRLWEVATQTYKQTGESQNRRVSIWATKFSPDGKVLASSSYDSTVKLWDTSTKALRHTLEGHKSVAGDLAFSPDSTVLATASLDATIRLWNVTTGACEQILEWLGASSVDMVTFSPNGKVLASADADSNIRLWDVTTGVTLQNFESDSVKSLLFSGNGNLLACGSIENAVRLWDVEAGLWKETAETDLEAISLLFSDNGQLLKCKRGVLSLSSSLTDTGLEEQSTKAITVEWEWVTEDGQNILWFPPDYRPTSEAVYSNLVVLGLRDGSIIFLEFSPY